MRRRPLMMLVALVLIGAPCGGGYGGRSAFAEESGSLKELAAAHNLKIGSVVQFDPDPRYETVFTREYNVLTVYAGWEVVHPESRQAYDFTSTDQAVQVGTRNGFEMQGQSLVWYYQIPPWVQGLPPAEVEAVMNEHIDRVVGRYAGRVRAWNVVNEAVDDEGRGLRRGFAWSDAMGDEYIAKAFLRAHRADPNAVLYYNEDGMQSSEAIFRTVKGLLQRLLDGGVPVHALGWQMHVKTDFDSRPLLGRMTEIADMGLDNYITELDVELPEMATRNDFERQKEIYQQVVQVFLQAPRRRNLVVWGLRDGLDSDWLTRNHPLPFDEQYQKKPAYFGIREALLPEPPAISSPRAGSTLSSSVTLTWGAGSPPAAQYWVHIGSSPGGADLYNRDQGTALTTNVSGIPQDGRAVYVRLWYRTSGSWQYADTNYTAAGTREIGAPVLTSPTPGSTLSSPTVTVSWSAGTDALQYWLYVGSTAGGADLYNRDQGTALSAGVSGLPTDGRTIYLRLWYLVSGGWRSIDAAVAAAGQQ